MSLFHMGPGAYVRAGPARRPEPLQGPAQARGGQHGFMRGSGTG